MSLSSISYGIGIVAFIAGVALVFAPSILRKVNDISAKSVTKIDTLTFTYRIWVGAALLIASAFMFFIAYRK
jgi:TRAP-type C4-dicarboxylate transport system permease small subunit